MGVITLENEFVVAVAPAKLFKAYCLDADTLLPKILPEHIKSSEIVEGNGGPGTIRKITFTEGKELSYAKQRIESIDEENLTYSFSLIEANVWKDAVEKVTYEHKFEPTPEGGSICKRTSTYHIKGDAEINKDEIKDVYGKRRQRACSKLSKPTSWPIQMPKYESFHNDKEQYMKNLAVLFDACM
uniref:Bet v I/Major latex protein domain-containing protein n=1 Tax=Salix viminalis TaxID=40686 RepID=A0A6N2NAV3_SALVM